MAEASPKPSSMLARWREGKDGRVARRELLRMLPRISRAYCIVLAVLLVVGTSFNIVFLLATGALIGTVPEAVTAGFDSAAGRRLVVLLAAVATLFVIEAVLNPIQDLITASFSRRVSLDLRRRVMRATLTPRSVAHLEDPATLDLIRDAQGVGSGDWGPAGAVQGIMQNIRSRTAVLASGAIVAGFRWWLALLLLGFGAIVRYRLVDDALRGASWGREQTPKLRRSDYLRDLALEPSAAKETRVFGLRSWVLDRFTQEWTRGMTEIWRHRKHANASSWAWSIPWGGLTMFALYTAGSAAASGEIALGQVAVLLQAILGAGSIWLSNADVQVAYGALSVPAIAKLESASAGAHLSSGTRDPAGSPRDAIRFEGVSFRYPGRDDDVYTDLDLEIEAGRSLAIVGRNGAGKTTLAKLLARLYDPTSGRITVDGTDVREFDGEAWQRRIGAIFQDYVRYELSAADNIGYGAVENLGDADALAAAAREAGALQLVEGLPKGWETILARHYTDGADLSGGEWQRVALARALFAVRGGAGVLILDEPTANLDVRAEAEIFDRFLAMTRGLTTILISHRFSTVRHADRICVLEHGRIIESGTHGELLAANGRYAEMFHLQAARFQDDAAVGADGG